MTHADWKQTLAQFEWDDDVIAARRMAARLASRAQAYAAPLDQTSGSTEFIHVIEFNAGGEHYAIDVRWVRGVRALGKVSRVPGTPAHYRGVMNVRGQVMSVLDLIAFFGLPPSERPAQECILVQGEGLELVLLADHIEGVRDIPQASIQAAELRYAIGMGAGRLILLNMEAILTDPALIVGGSHDPNE